MAGTVNFSLRLPSDLAAAIGAKSVATGCTKAEVMCDYIRMGMQAEMGGAPATREDVAALREQVAALTELQKAQAISIMDGVKRAVESAPVPVIGPGTSSDDVASAVKTAVEAVERSAAKEADARVGEAAAAARIQAVRDARDEAAEEIERSRSSIEAEGYRRAMEEFKSASPISRLLGRF